MPSNSSNDIGSFVHRLQQDHRSLMSAIGDVRQWVRDVSELGMPRFGELGVRLRPFRELLSAHFADEESGEFPASGGQSGDGQPKAGENLAGLHHRILEDLDSMIARLRASEPPFRSWQAAIEELEALIKVIEQHEEYEMNLLQGVA